MLIKQFLKKNLKTTNMCCRYRIAKPCDAKRIAEIQIAIKEVNSLGIFCKMGIGFLTEYYRQIIEDPDSVFICAVNDNDLIVGYSFNILDAAKQTENLRKHKLRLAFSSLSTIIRKPSIINELWKRYKSVENSDDTYIHNEGAHGGYWGWDPQHPDPSSSLYLHELTSLITKNLGINKIYFEVDNDNKNVLKFHKLNGAIVEKQFSLPDGRVRSFMYYDLDKHKYKL